MRHAGWRRPPIAAASAAIVAGVPVGLLVLAERDRSLEVLLPTRPNDTTGWNPRDRTDTRIAVSLQARRVRLFRNGAVVASSGCIRVPDTFICLLARHAREGTPVDVS